MERRCDICGNTIDSSNSLTCGSCGVSVCGSCANSNGGLCSHCYDKVNYNN